MAGASTIVTTPRNCMQTHTTNPWSCVNEVLPYWRFFFRQVWSVGRERAQRVYVESSNLALVIGIDDVVGAEGLHPLSATVLAAHKRLHHAAW